MEQLHLRVRERTCHRARTILGAKRPSVRRRAASVQRYHTKHHLPGKTVLPIRLEQVHAGLSTVVSATPEPPERTTDANRPPR